MDEKLLHPLDELLTVVQTEVDEKLGNKELRSFRIPTAEDFRTLEHEQFKLLKEKLLLYSTLPKAPTTGARYIRDRNVGNKVGYSYTPVVGAGGVARARTVLWSVPVAVEYGPRVSLGFDRDGYRSIGLSPGNREQTSSECSVPQGERNDGGGPRAVIRRGGGGIEILAALTPVNQSSSASANSRSGATLPEPNNYLYYVGEITEVVSIIKWTERQRHEAILYKSSK
ncbi:hypothetical protein AAMO2058_001182000 [Amorphochlora amoebiformis]